MNSIKVLSIPFAAVHILFLWSDLPCPQLASISNKRSLGMDELNSIELKIYYFDNNIIFSNILLLFWWWLYTWIVIKRMVN